MHKPLKLYCDASPHGVGACLMHVIDGVEKPVTFASRTLSVAEQNYAQVEREALGIIFGVKRFNQYLYGREFILATDHRPLCKLFGHADGVRPVAAARMQRWALILSAYSYKIEYIAGSANSCADCLSRLPVPSTKSHPAEEGNVIHATNCVNLPITARDIASSTAKDKILARVYTCVQHGTWPFPMPEELAPYHRKKDEMTIHDGCLLWGKRVIVPRKLHSKLLEELHVGHVGVCRMKALARSFIWWPGLDKAIEEVAAQCKPCKVTVAMPKAVSRHPWQLPSGPWERVHVDYGEWNNHYFFVLVDAFSKWPKVKAVSSTTSKATINILRDIFSTYGFPQMVVSDNGPQFTSSAFQNFLSENHIIHHKSPPYHPATNSLAENMVKSVKAHLKKHNTDIYRSIPDFLMTYRNIPHTTTGVAPAHLILAQAPRTHLSMTSPSLYQRIKPQLQPTPEQTNEKVRKFQLGDKVLVRDFRPASTTKWQSATITAVCGALIYEVDCEGHHRQVHIDHLLPAARTSTTGPQNTVVSDIPPEARDCVEPDSFETPSLTDNDQSNPEYLVH